MSLISLPEQPIPLPQELAQLPLTEEVVRGRILRHRPAHLIRREPPPARFVKITQQEPDAAAGHLLLIEQSQGQPGVEFERRLGQARGRGLTWGRGKDASSNGTSGNAAAGSATFTRPNARRTARPIASLSYPRWWYNKPADEAEMIRQGRRQGQRGTQ